MWLSVATLVAVIVRMGISFRENNALVAALHDDASTDSLTKLANRRKLLDDLEPALATGRDARGSHVFALYDLDGFKLYNDTYGHPAGSDRADKPCGRPQQSRTHGERTHPQYSGPVNCTAQEANPSGTPPLGNLAISASDETASFGMSWLSNAPSRLMALTFSYKLDGGEYTMPYHPERPNVEATAGHQLHGKRDSPVLTLEKSTLTKNLPVEIHATCP